MAVVELDPVFVKALRFLHSKSRDSADQLKQLLDDAIAQRKGQKTAVPPSDSKVVSKSVLKHQEEEKQKKRESEKRSLDKLKKELSDLSDEVPVKKARHDSTQPVVKVTPPVVKVTPPVVKVVQPVVKVTQPVVKVTQPVVKVKEEEASEARREEKSSKDRDKERRKEAERKAKIEREEKERQEKSDDSEDEDKSIDADDFAFDLGIACVVCKGFDVTSGNQLVECQECHNLYHQECHKPPVTEQDVNDPRFVWYCTSCTKTMKKMASASKSGKTKPSSSSSSSSKDSTPSFSNPSSSSSSSSSSSTKITKSDSTTLFSFRRVESKSSSMKDPSNSTGNRPLSGLASLAANLSGKGDQSKSNPVSRSESSAKLTSKPELSKVSSKHDHGEKSSGKTKSSEVAAKPGGIKLGVDIFKNLPKAETVKTSSKSSSSGGGGSSSSGSSGSSSKQPPGGSSSVVNADKRLQMMKKKAAAKLQEKRSSLR